LEGSPNQDKHLGRVVHEGLDDTSENLGAPITAYYSVNTCQVEISEHLKLMFIFQRAGETKGWRRPAAKNEGYLPKAQV
jgi:hypothetical protein